MFMFVVDNNYNKKKRTFSPLFYHVILNVQLEVNVCIQYQSQDVFVQPVAFVNQYDQSGL